MKYVLRLCVGIALSVSAASGLLAQTPPAPSGPPKVLQIFREEVKAGRAAAHQKWETGWPKAFAKANWPTNYLTMVSVTGPTEAWFMTAYDSFAAWGKDIEGLDKNTAFKNEYDRLSEGDAQFLSGARSIVAAFREDLSTPVPAVPVVLPKMRYFRVITFRVRPGHDSDFMDAAKMIRAGYEKAKVELGWATYQIVSGMATPTFMVFLPMKSLDEIDTGLMNSKKLADAQGEENQKKLAKMAADGYLSVETNIYAFDPKMSYPAKDFAAADPEFWNPKPASPAKKPAAKPAQ
jgi:hypothetical protein